MAVQGIKTRPIFPSSSPLWVFFWVAFIVTVDVTLLQDQVELLPYNRTSIYKDFLLSNPAKRGSCGRETLDNKAVV